MFAESIESNNTASSLYRVPFLDQLSTVDKTAIIASTLVMRQFRRMWVHDLAKFTLLTRDGRLLYLGLPDVPPITFPWHQYQLCLCTTAGAILAAGAQHGCLPTYNPSRSHLPGHKARCFSVKVSGEKSIWFPLAPFLQVHCQNSEFTPHSTIWLHLRHDSRGIIAEINSHLERSVVISANGRGLEAVPKETEHILCVACDQPTFKQLFSSI